MEDVRKCKNCRKELIRRVKNGLQEKGRDFRRREFCDRKCSGAYSRRKATTPEQVAVSEAVKDLSSSDEKKTKTAKEYLEDVINGNVAGADIITRVNAAKALLPYQEKKADEKQGKKDAKNDAAKQAADGKFGSRPAPANVILIRKEG